MQYIQFMSYSKCWNCRRTWNLCFLFIFSWKKLQPNFAFWDTFKLLRCPNSKEIKLRHCVLISWIELDESISDSYIWVNAIYCRNKTPTQLDPWEVGIGREYARLSSVTLNFNSHRKPCVHHWYNKLNVWKNSLIYGGDVTSSFYVLCSQ